MEKDIVQIIIKLREGQSTETAFAGIERTLHEQGIMQSEHEYLSQIQTVLIRYDGRCHEALATALKKLPYVQEVTAEQKRKAY